MAAFGEALPATARSGLMLFSAPGHVELGADAGRAKPRSTAIFTHHRSLHQRVTSAQLSFTCSRQWR